ncbi:serine hydrolase [Pseudomonas sp. H9]|uniref:serine hydrolase domain-containing protein n=1 Tax=Pseudomonas sp. H9 TaxID=483968 RepID=UPI0010581B98|nr:serine hydrolase [Pseudomonas sp. H9]TDF77696.1 class C beta-lactamase-related serine hydrolase [Pseudomonas sp. H9]
MPALRDALPDSVPTAHDGLLRATASETGVDPDRLIAFLDDVADAGLDLHGMILHRHGNVAAEGWKWPYTADRPRILHSVAKSFTACAIGLAVDEGLLQLSDTVVSFFPEHLPKHTDPRLPSMTVEHLLTMRTGHQSNTSGSVWRSIDSSWITEFFKIPLVNEPGTQYVYTSAASYMLSAIVSKVSGQTLHDYLRPRLFEPLGITDEHWAIGPDGINPGGNGLTATPASMLKLGILHAQDGVWEGRRILSSDWVQAATRPQGGQDSKYGYHWAIKPQGAYCAVGVFVQMAIVFPSSGATLALVGAMKNSAQIIPHIERHFPAAFLDTRQPAGEADKRLQQRLDAMRQVPALDSLAASPFSTTATVEAEVEDNDLGVTRLTFAFTADTLAIELTDSTGTHRIVNGLNRWHQGTTDMPGSELHHGYTLTDEAVVAGARWLDPSTLEMQWIYVASAFRDTVRCAFTEEGLTWERTVNVNSGALAQPLLRGRWRHV